MIGSFRVSANQKVTMNLQLKLRIDHFVGGSLAWLLNAGARLAALVIKRDHSLRSPPVTVLFLKFTGLGSIARAAFLIAAVRERYPSSRIAYACFPGCAGLLKLYPQVDEVVVIRDGDLVRLGLDTLRMIYWSWRNRVQLVIDLEVHSKYSSVVSGLTLARDRAGFGGVTSRFRRGLYTHLVFMNPLRRVDLAYRQLGNALGLDVAPKLVRPVPPRSAVQEVDAVLEKLGVAEQDLLLGVNPNASELRLERRWPLQQFARVIEALPTGRRIHVVLLGSPGEHAYVEQLVALTASSGHPVHNLAGRVSFAAFTDLLDRLTVLLSNDSGPLHLAATLDTPTVSVWGPTHPATYAPRGDRHKAFYRPIYCSPCVHTTDVPPCAGDNQCLKQLDWRPVAGAVVRMLGVPTGETLREFHELPKDRSHDVYGYWRRTSVPLPSKWSREQP
ncbi:MAG: glycosyltransferase family 9 protein [Planctomycetota bacterium]|nr:glycosyltransferase family 9 protein [Planctomycetota bacterium]